MALFFTRRACSVIRASSFLGWGHGYNYPGRRRLIHPSAWRDCPKSLRRTFNIALRATKEGVLVHFALRIPAKSTLEVLLIPLFGQSLHALGWISLRSMHRGSKGAIMTAGVRAC